MDTVHGRMGMGIVVQDNEGYVVAARSLTKLGRLEPVATEALTVFQVAEFSKGLGLQDIIMECNTLQVVNAMRSTGQNWSRFGQLVKDMHVT
jgi:hypothetical protein